MIAKVQSLIGYVLALGLVGLGVWAFIEAVQSEPAIVGSIAAVVGGFAGVQWQQRRVEREKLQQARRERIAPTYGDLIEYIRKAAERAEAADGREATDEQKATLTDEDRNFFASLQDTLILWGPKPVIETWASAMRLEEDQMVVGYLALLAAIRKDLGHEDEGMAVRDLARVFLTDGDDYISEDLKL